jgi:hypothetical protein
MSKPHGKNTVITVATKDISPYTKTSTYTRSAKSHDTTGYGVDDEDYEAGLKGGKFSMGGTYDNTASVGPRNALHGLVGTKVAVVRKTEGTGTGKPQDTFSMVLESYVETNPHDDMISWTAEGTIAGGVTTTAQS